jgi:hypothetical protein
LITQGFFAPVNLRERSGCIGREMSRSQYLRAKREARSLPDNRHDLTSLSFLKAYLLSYA